MRLKIDQKSILYSQKMLAFIQKKRKQINSYLRIRKNFIQTK